MRLHISNDCQGRERSKSNARCLDQDSWEVDGSQGIGKCILQQRYDIQFGHCYTKVPGGIKEEMLSCKLEIYTWNLVEALI